MRAGAWPVPTIAAAGLLIAANLVLGRVTGSAWLCAEGSGCGVVHASRHATLLGLPNAAWGAALYAVVGGLALSGLSPRRWLTTFLLSVAGLSASIYLASVAWVVIDAACVYCLVATGVAAALVVALVPRRPRVSAPRSLLGARSLVVLATLTALGTVAIVAALQRHDWLS